ncbi:MAG: hypothetical protein IT457_11585 [Planctomycetes bacterium]|nr:hypothetical protein [Planctomycetota bacterium]
MSSKRVLAAIAVVVVLGGGSAAFVVWRAAQEREQRADGLLASVASELALERPEVEDLRRLLREVRELDEADPRPGLKLAGAELLVALGRQGEGWESIADLVTVPGALDAHVRVGARVAAACHAVSGEVAVGRQALALAASVEGSDDELAPYRALAWQLAFRLGEIDEWLARTREALDGSVNHAAARGIRALAKPLGVLFAARVGLDVAAPLGEVQVALAKLLGEVPASTRATLETAADAWPGSRAEFELAFAAALLDEVGALDPSAPSGDTERALRAALERAELALASQPSSCDARHVAVIAYAGLRQAFGLRDDDVTRARGHLRWLLQNAPDSHLARPIWQQLQAVL